MARSRPNFRRFVESISIDNAGASYSSIAGDTNLFIGPPDASDSLPKRQATATVEVVSNIVQSITITDHGDGYVTAPVVYIQSGLFVATDDGLTNTTVANAARTAGTYNNVSFQSSKDGTGAIGNVTIDSSGQVSSYEITTSGSFYMEGESVFVTDISIAGDGSLPNLTFTVTKLKGGGNGATFTATTNIIAETISYYHEGMSYLIDDQIPDFVNEEYPNFALFIKDYYRFLDASAETFESTGVNPSATTATTNKYGANYLLEEMIDNLNIDHDADDFLQIFLEQYALDFPKFAEVDSKLLIKHIREFFEAKGSRKGVEAFFRMVYNENAEVVLPADFMLIPSDGIFTEEVTIKVNPNLEISPNGDPFTLRGKRCDINYYESTGSLTARKSFNVGVSRVEKIAYTNPAAFELTVDLPRNTIVPGQGVECDLTAVIGGKPATINTIGAADVSRAAGTYGIGKADYTTAGNGGKPNGGGTVIDANKATFRVVVNGSGAASVSLGGAIATVDTIGAADSSRTAGTYTIGASDWSVTDGGTTIAQTAPKDATFSVVVDSSGAATITVTDGGEGFLVDDTITIADAQLGGGGGANLTFDVATITIDGDNFAPAETITVADSKLGSGGGAALTFNIATITNGRIFSVTINDGGAGYSANPAVVITPNSSDTITTVATLSTRLTNNAVSSVIFDNNNYGVGYNNVPTLTLNTDAVRSYISLEGLSDIITNKNSFLTRVLTGVALKTNTGTADGGFNVGDVFSVAETGDILGVYAIDYFGEDYTITGISNNALVRIKTLDSSNYPAIVDIISTGTGFQRASFDFVLTSDNGETATITCTTGFSNTYPGDFKNSRGFLSDANKLRDNRVYQNYAYQIRTSRPKTEWGELLDRIAHPAGMIAFTDLQIEQVVNVGDSFAAVPDIIVFRLFAEVETPTVQDVPVLFVTKVVTDSVDWADPHSLQPNLIKTESPAAVDAVNKFDVTLAKTESPSATDAPALDVHKPTITDSVDWSELVDILLIILRTPTDSIDWAETVVLTPNLIKNDSIDMSEVVAKASETTHTDDFEFQDVITNLFPNLIKTEDPSVDDAPVLLFTSTQTEGIAWGESGQIIAQNYAGDYFAEDYVGEARTIS